MEDIDCGGATYTTLTFAGNFDGQNKTISNAKFSPAAGAYADGFTESITCCGLFNSLHTTQKIVNLKLDSISTTGSTLTDYSGALAGVIDGTVVNGEPQALIQNVQVTNCSISGRSAAGVVGFCRGATVKFCSSKDSTISGLANGGGIVGLVSGYMGIVTNCYSTTAPTALTFMNGSAGGVAGKLVRGGNTNTCWSTMTVVGNPDAGSASNNVLAGSSTQRTEFLSNGFETTYWTIRRGTATTFTANVYYEGFSNKP